MPDWIGTFQNRARHDCSNGVNTALTRPGRVFPRPFTHGGTSAGGQSVNGGETHEGGHTPLGI